MGVTAAGWAVTIGVIVALLGLDLLLATVRLHAVGYRRPPSGLWATSPWRSSSAWASQAWRGGLRRPVLRRVPGGKSLSVDNLFVFVIIMATFTVPREHQQRVLVFGIMAALALRAVFIAVGAALLSLLSFMFLIFGLLLWTAVRLYRHRNEDPDVSDIALVRVLRRILSVSDTYAGGRLISRSGGRRVVTPLFIVFIAIGGTDILFALDSIPAVFGVTSQPYFVFTANAFALLGLRALFFLATGLPDRLVYLAVMLAFIGVKLILHRAHRLESRVPEITTGLSLTVIAAVLAITTLTSLIKSRRDPAGTRARRSGARHPTTRCPRSASPGAPQARRKGLASSLGRIVYARIPSRRGPSNHSPEENECPRAARGWVRPPVLAQAVSRCAARTACPPLSASAAAPRWW